MEFSVKDTLRASIEAVSGGRNTIMYDDQGNPNIMVCIPKFDTKYMGVPINGTHPAFNLGNGKECPEIWVSKYQNVPGIGGVPVSALPLNDRIPANYVNKSEHMGHILNGMYNCTPSQGSALCEKKGKGWHLISNLEWCATFQQGNVMRTGPLIKNRAENFYGSFDDHSHDGTPDGVMVARMQPEVVDGIAFRWYDEIYTWIDSNDIVCNDFVNKPMKPSGIRIDGGDGLASSSFPNVHMYKCTNRPTPTEDGRVIGHQKEFLHNIKLVSPIDDTTITRIKNMGLVNVNDYDSISLMVFSRAEQDCTGEELSMIRATEWSDGQDMAGYVSASTTPMTYALSLGYNSYGIRSVWISPDYL